MGAVSGANGTTTITGSDISFNDAAYGDGGGGVLGGVNTITNSTISSNTAAIDGGGIWSAGEIEIADSTLSGNSAGSGKGGGIFGDGMIQITRSTFTFNFSGNSAGAIHGGNDEITITESTISDNVAGGSGGGISTSLFNTMTIIGSTISDNSAYGDGGGVNADGTTTVIDSTISGNSAYINGGGIFIDSSTLTIVHSTISANVADANGNGTGTGGGVSGIVAGSTVDHSIVAGNLRGLATRDDIFGSTDATYSLIGDDTGATITDNGGNLIGTGGAPIDPRLAPLADHGGPTETHALLFGSPALDAGDPSFSPPPDYDQRGAPFARVVGSDIDMGAYEAQSPPLEGDLNGDRLVDSADAGIMFANWAATGSGFAGLSYADGNLNGDEFIDAADFGILAAETTVAPLTASFAASLDSPSQSVVGSFKASPTATLKLHESTSGVGSQIILRTDGPGLGSFQTTVHDHRAEPLRDVNRFEVALEDGWEGIDAITTEREDLARELVELGGNGHSKRHTSATDDLFASLAEEDGFTGLRSPW